MIKNCFGPEEDDLRILFVYLFKENDKTSSSSSSSSYPKRSKEY